MHWMKKLKKTDIASEYMILRKTQLFNAQIARLLTLEFVEIDKYWRVKDD